MVGVVVVIATGKWIESFLLGIRAVNPLAISSVAADGGAAE
jgi:hypothetical protein